MAFEDIFKPLSNREIIKIKRKLFFRSSKVKRWLAFIVSLIIAFIFQMLDPKNPTIVAIWYLPLTFLLLVFFLDDD